MAGLVFDVSVGAGAPGSGLVLPGGADVAVAIAKPGKSGMYVTRDASWARPEFAAPRAVTGAETGGNPVPGKLGTRAARDVSGARSGAPAAD